MLEFALFVSFIWHKNAFSSPEKYNDGNKAVVEKSDKRYNAQWKAQYFVNAEWTDIFHT